MDIDEKSQREGLTFKEAVEGLRKMERNCNGNLKITKWPKHIGDSYALQSQDIPNAVHNLYSWILNDAGLIKNVKELGCRENLEGGFDN